MRIAFTVFLAVIVSVSLLGQQAFDESAYTKTTLEEIYAGAPRIEEGADLFLKKRQFVVKLKDGPRKCSNGWITVVFRTLGVESPPPVSHCVTVESESGLVNEMYVQDVLVESLGKEVRPGGTFTAYVLYCFFNGHTKKPGFVLSEFDPVTTDVS